MKMLKDFDFNLKSLPYLLLVFGGTIACVLHIRAHQSIFEPVFKNFQLSPSEVEGILVFSVIFFLMVRLISNSLVLPFVKLNEKREDYTINKIKEANVFLEEARVLEDEFYKKANEEKRRALTQKAVILTEARRQAEDIVFQTENEISFDIASAKERIDLKTKIMLNELALRKQEFSDLVQNKVLNF